MADDLRAHPLLKRFWYYSIELAPGVITQGLNFPSIGLVRELLSRIPVEGQRCLDLCAMEGLCALLMERRGASEVLAWDRPYEGTNASPEQLELLRECLGAKLAYRRDRRLADFGQDGAPYDVVVFAGVLYHVFDPLTTLLHARRHVRDGGLLLLESAALAGDQATMHFNAKGCYYPEPGQGNYWFPTVGCLHYLCRLARLEPLDRCYIPGEPMRMGLVCRAQAGPSQDDKWLAGQHGAGSVGANFAECIDWERTASGLPPVPYTPRSTFPHNAMAAAAAQARTVLHLSDKA